MYSRIAFFIKDFSLYLIVIFASIFLFILFVLRVLKSSCAPKTKKILLAVGFFVVCAVLAFSVFEGYFRYVYDESDGLGFLQVNKRWQQRHVVYNNYFKRDRNFEVEKEKGFIRIGVVGDSITFGQGIEDVNNRFSNLLEEKLRSNNLNAQVYNLGVPGLDTHEEIEFYEDVSHLNFDVIVLQYYPNDIQPTDKGEPSTIISENAYPNELIKWATQKSTFLDFIYWRFSSKYATTFNNLGSHYLNMYNSEEILNNHKEELSDFINELKKENKEIVVIIFPFIELIGPNYPATEAHNKLQDFFKSQDIQTIDLLDDLKGANWKDLVASKFDTHPNEKVHNLAAEKLYEIIYPKLK